MEESFLMKMTDEELIHLLETGHDHLLEIIQIILNQRIARSLEITTQNNSKVSKSMNIATWVIALATIINVTMTVLNVFFTK